MSKLEICSSENQVPCLMPWTSFFFFGGKQGVKNCCWQNIRLDDKPYSSIENIWNSENAKKIRKKMLSGDHMDICPKSCPMLVSGKTNYNWFNTFKDYLNNTYSDESVLDNFLRCKESVEDGKIYLDSKPLFWEVFKPYECNIDCVMCWEKYYEPDKRGIELANFPDYDKYFRNVKLIHYTGGEPLITSKSDINNILKNYPGKGLSLITNGIVIDRIDFQAYLNRFNWITISLNGANKKMHENINRGSSWEKVIRNLNSILSIKEEKKYKYPDITINMVVMSTNYMQIPDFIKLGKEMGCGINFQLHRVKGFTNNDITYSRLNKADISKLLCIIEPIVNNPKKQSYGLDSIKVAYGSIV